MRTGGFGERVLERNLVTNRSPTLVGEPGAKRDIGAKRDFATTAKSQGRASQRHLYTPKKLFPFDSKPRGCARKVKNSCEI